MMVAAQNDVVSTIPSNQDCEAIIDPNHQLYLHPSDTPGLSLTSIQLTGVETYPV